MLTIDKANKLTGHRVSIKSVGDCFKGFRYGQLSLYHHHSLQQPRMSRSYNDLTSPEILRRRYFYFRLQLRPRPNNPEPLYLLRDARDALVSAQLNANVMPDPLNRRGCPLLKATLLLAASAGLLLPISAACAAGSHAVGCAH